MSGQVRICNQLLHWSPHSSVNYQTLNLTSDCIQQVKIVNKIFVFDVNFFFNCVSDLQKYCSKSKNTTIDTLTWSDVERPNFEWPGTYSGASWIFFRTVYKVTRSAGLYLKESVYTPNNHCTTSQSFIMLTPSQSHTIKVIWTAQNNKNNCQILHTVWPPATTGKHWKSSF